MYPRLRTYLADYCCARLTKRWVLGLALWLLCWQATQAQTYQRLRFQQQIDSLLGILETKNNLRERLPIWLELGKRYPRINPKQGVEATNQLFSLQARPLLDSNTRAEAHFWRGFNYMMLGVYALSLEDYLVSLKFAEKMQNSTLATQVRKNIGNLYTAMGSHHEAIGHFSRVLQEAIRAQDTAMIVSCYNNLGVNHYELGQYTISLQYHESAQKLIRPTDTLMLCYSKANQGKAQLRKGLVEEAATNLLQALVVFKQYQNERDLVELYIALSELGEARKQLNIAAAYIDSAYTLAQKLDTRPMLAEVYWQQAQIYKKQGRTEQAIAKLEAYAVLRDTLLQEQSTMQMLELKLRYDLQLQDRSNFLNQKQAEQMRLEQEQQRRTIQRQYLVAVVISLLLAVAVVSLLFLFKTQRDRNRIHQLLQEKHEEVLAQAEELRQTNDSLKQAHDQINEINHNLERLVDERTQQWQRVNKELDMFLYRASHDMLRPITSLKGLTNLAHLRLKDPEALEIFKQVEDTSNQMDKMVLKLIMVSNIGDAELSCEYVPVGRNIKKILQGFTDLIESKQIRVQYDIDRKAKVFSNDTLLHYILYNLIENAIQFMPTERENPEILIDFRLDSNDRIEMLSIEDNGSGISVIHHDEVYDMYFRGHEYSQGNGLGLYVVRKCAEKLGIGIKLSSQLNQYTRFELHFPQPEAQQRTQPRPAPALKTKG